MLDAGFPVEAHAVEHVLELAEVQALVRADHVEAAVEGELLVAVEDGG